MDSSTSNNVMMVDVAGAMHHARTWATPITDYWNANSNSKTERMAANSTRIRGQRYCDQPQTMIGNTGL